MTTTITENGALSHATTGSSVLDIFFKIVRTTTQAQVDEMLSRAWAENPLLTLKAIFHLRDCRGGKGEKARFYDAMRWLIKSGHSKHVLANLEHIPFYGTYKDLLVLAAETELEPNMIKLYAETLAQDVRNLSAAIESGNVNKSGHANVTISLAGKWAPTEGGSLDKKHHYARKLVKQFKNLPDCCVEIAGMKDYRTKVVVPLRNHLEVVERFMCSQNWDEIDFEHVPSVAMKNYRKAFMKREEARFKKYLDDVKNGVSKINANQVFPHQLVEHYINGGAYDETIELQWKEIVRTVKSKFMDAGTSAFPLIDVSGSMSGTPMIVAIALGLLLSECACEKFRGSMLTFHENPTLFRVDTSLSLKDKVAKIHAMPWGCSTNLQSAFNVLLNSAQSLGVKSSDLPKTLYIFSDMQFNVACPRNTITNFQEIADKYAAFGYTRPNIVFWNLRGDTIDFPVEQHVPNTALVSGFSPSLMELFISGEVISPYAVMLKALSAPRYQKIQLGE